jgi:hypothetical protein
MMKACASVLVALGLSLGAGVAKTNADFPVGQYNVLYQGKPFGSLCIQGDAPGWNYWYAVTIFSAHTGVPIPAQGDAGRWGVMYASPEDRVGVVHFYGGSESAGYIDVLTFDAGTMEGSWLRWYPTFRDGTFYEGNVLQFAKTRCDPKPNP